MLQWDYKDEKAWDLVEGCVSGKGACQSPIDIQSKTVVPSLSLKPLVLTGWDKPVAGVCSNNGATILFTPTTDSKGQPALAFQNHKGSYVLKQFHIHWGKQVGEGAEHSVDGKHHDAELHFVTLKEGMAPSSTEKDAYAVVGVLLKASKTGSSVDVDNNTTWNKLPVPIELKQALTVSDLVCGDFLPQSLDYYHYEGSLTTPPCSEVVQWFLLKDPVEVPEDFLRKLQQMKTPSNETLVRNHRSIQPLNERVVTMPHPDCEQ